MVATLTLVLRSIPRVPQLLSGRAVAVVDAARADAAERIKIRELAGPPPKRSHKLPTRELGRLIDELLLEARKAAGGGGGEKRSVQVQLPAFVDGVSSR